MLTRPSLAKVAELTDARFFEAFSVSTPSTHVGLALFALAYTPIGLAWSLIGLLSAGWSLDAVNRLNQRIVELIKEDGRVYVSSTLIEGRYLIRYAGVTHRTHLSTVRLLLDQLDAAARRVEHEMAVRPAQTEAGSAV